MGERKAQRGATGGSVCVLRKEESHMQRPRPIECRYFGRSFGGGRAWPLVSLAGNELTVGEQVSLLLWKLRCIGLTQSTTLCSGSSPGFEVRQNPKFASDLCLLLAV